MRQTLLVAFLITALHAIAQPYGNEWIDYSTDRTYLKFYAGEKGVYRIDRATLEFALQQIGKSVNNIDPRSFQVFAKGEEQYIHVAGAADGKL